MATGSQSKLLSTDDAAYIAGLIDGEGTITLSRLHANEMRRLVVSIASTEIQLLQFVLDTFGAGKITRKKTVSDHHAPSHCFAVTSRQALSLLGQVAPYLRSYKRSRADLVLAQYVALTPRNGRYTPEQLAKRSKFETRLLSMRARRFGVA